MPCKNHNYKGDYGFTATGVVLDPKAMSGSVPWPAQPFSVVGRFTADGKGNITGTQTRNFEGTITTPEAYTETYTVNADCTGSSKKKTTMTGIVVNFAFVVLHGGKTIIGIETDINRAVTFRAERMD
jgi:hypothetical protein